MVEVIQHLNSFKIRRDERRCDWQDADAGDGYREVADYSLCLARYLQYAITKRGQEMFFEDLAIYLPHNHETQENATHRKDRGTKGICQKLSSLKAKFK